MRRSCLSLSLVLLLSCTGAQADIGQLVLLSEVDDGAVCLDGTPAGYYFAEGTESTKYVFFFQGGGWCTGLDVRLNKGTNPCWSRWGTGFGSSNSYSPTTEMNSLAFLGNDSATNPQFYNYNKVFLRYCDGGSFGGDVDAPIVDPDDSTRLMYFRGKRIVDAVFKSLIADYGAGDATDFIIGGGSAGGLAVYLHINYIVDNYFDLTKTKVVALPDVGFFLDYNGYEGQTNYANSMKWVFENQNLSSSIADPQCFKSHSADIAECMFPQNMARDITVPTFLLNSQYDAFQATSILGTGTSNPALLNEYGQNWSSLVFNNFLSKNTTAFGAYIDSCYHHGAQDPVYWSGLHIDGYTQAQAFQQYYEGLGTEGNRMVWYHNTTYPCAACCPNTSVAA